MIRRVLQRDDPLPAQVASRRGPLRRADLLRGEAIELGRAVDDHGAVLAGFQYVLFELGHQRGNLLVELAQMRLVRLRECGSSAHKHDVIALEELQRLGIELQTRTASVQRIDAGKQRRIEQDRILVRREPRRHLGIDLVHVRIGIRAVEVGEDGVHPVEELPSTLEGHYGVREVRRVRIARDSRDFLALLPHARFECRHVIRVFDSVKRWQPVGQRARLPERIVRHCDRPRMCRWCATLRRGRLPCHSGSQDRQQY